MGKKMKSALEIALEKSKKIKQDNKKNLDESEQEKYVKAAAILGNSFLQGKVKKEEVRGSINRYPERHRKAAIASFIGKITEEMTLTNTPGILQAIVHLKEDDDTRNACEEAKKLFYQYKKQLEERFNQLQENAAKSLRKRLEKEGIKGSAIASFNIKNLKEWKEASTQVQKEYTAILESFRAAVRKPG